jgi:hypothetical protein
MEPSPDKQKEDASPLQRRLRQVADGFDFSALLEGVETPQTVAAPASPEPAPKPDEDLSGEIGEVPAHVPSKALPSPVFGRGAGGEGNPRKLLFRAGPQRRRTQRFRLRRLAVRLGLFLWLITLSLCTGAGLGGLVERLTPHRLAARPPAGSAVHNAAQPTRGRSQARSARQRARSPARATRYSAAPRAQGRASGSLESIWKGGTPFDAWRPALAGLGLASLLCGVVWMGWPDMAVTSLARWAARLLLGAAALAAMTAGTLLGMMVIEQQAHALRARPLAGTRSVPLHSSIGLVPRMRAAHLAGLGRIDIFLSPDYAVRLFRRQT